MTFDKTKYDIEYRKKHKKQFNVDLNIEEHEELAKLLKKHNLTRVQFVRDGLMRLKERP